MQMSNQLETWESLHAADSIEQKLDVVRAHWSAARQPERAAIADRGELG